MEKKAMTKILFLADVLHEEDLPGDLVLLVIRDDHRQRRCCKKFRPPEPVKFSSCR